MQASEHLDPKRLAAVIVGIIQGLQYNNALQSSIVRVQSIGLQELGNRLWVVERENQEKTAELVRIRELYRQQEKASEAVRKKCRRQTRQCSEVSAENIDLKGQVAELRRNLNLVNTQHDQVVGEHKRSMASLTRQLEVAQRQLEQISREYEGLMIRTSRQLATHMVKSRAHVI